MIVWPEVTVESRTNLAFSKRRNLDYYSGPEIVRLSLVFTVPGKVPRCLAKNSLMNLKLSSPFILLLDWNSVQHETFLRKFFLETACAKSKHSLFNNRQSTQHWKIKVCRHSQVLDENGNYAWEFPDIKKLHKAQALIRLDNTLRKTRTPLRWQNKRVNE